MTSTRLPASRTGWNCDGTGAMAKAMRRLNGVPVVSLAAVALVRRV